QIITAIANYLTNNFTKRQIIAFLIDADVVADPPARSFRPDGQIESEIDTTRDPETGALIATKQVLWSYYPTGEVDTITINDGTSLRTIKHYLSGQPPTVTIHAPLMAPAPAEPEPDDLLLIIPAVIVALAFAALAFFLTH
ncbi:MAG TPA: hypothetical protein VF784_14605, partial [Anaerolineales bacterium]